MKERGGKEGWYKQRGIKDREEWDKNEIVKNIKRRYDEAKEDKEEELGEWGEGEGENNESKVEGGGQWDEWWGE